MDKESTSSVTRNSSWQREKEQQLQSLNDRLAAYIEKVENLEVENVSLRESLLVLERADVSGELRRVYDEERLALRNSLDETHKRLTEADLEKQKVLEDFRNARKGEEDAIERAEFLSESLLSSEKRLAEERHAKEQLLIEINSVKERMERSEQRALHLEKECERLRKQVECELLSKVDLANQNLSLREELEFCQTINEKRNESTTTSSLEIRKETADQHHIHDQILTRLREESEAKIGALRRDAEKRLNACIARERQKHARTEEALLIAQQNAESVHRRLEEAVADRDELSRHVNSLTTSLHRLENELSEAQCTQAKLNERDRDEFERLNEALASLQFKHDELLELNITLDREIETYKKLVESGEQRLRKRPRYHSEERADEEEEGEEERGKQTRFTFVSFVEPTERSNHVHLINSNEQGVVIVGNNCTSGTFQLSGWRLKWLDDEGEEIVDYKFPRTATLEAGAEASVGAHGATFHMRKKWPSALNPHRVQLLDNDNEVISTLVVKNAIEQDDDDDQKPDTNIVKIEQKERSTSKIFGAIFGALF